MFKTQSQKFGTLSIDGKKFQVKNNIILGITDGEKEAFIRNSKSFKSGVIFEEEEMVTVPRNSIDGKTDVMLEDTYVCSVFTKDELMKLDKLPEEDRALVHDNAMEIVNSLFGTNQYNNDGAEKIRKTEESAGNNNAQNTATTPSTDNEKLLDENNLNEEEDEIPSDDELLQIKHKKDMKPYFTKHGIEYDETATLREMAATLKAYREQKKNGQELPK